MIWAINLEELACLPEKEIEVTPAMVAAMEETFSRWRGENSHLLDYELSGDLVDLRFRLNAAWTNSCKSA